MKHLLPGSVFISFLLEKKSNKPGNFLVTLKPFDLPETHKVETLISHGVLSSQMKTLIVFKEGECYHFLSGSVVFLACQLSYYSAKGKKSLLFLPVELKYRKE